MLANWRQLIVERYLTNTTNHAGAELVEEAEPIDSTNNRNIINGEDNNKPHQKPTEQSDSNEKIKDSLPLLKPTQAERKNTKTKTRKE